MAMGTGSGKGLSFGGTAGSTTGYLKDYFGLDEPTATVWAHIEPTQENYAGTEIPRSFLIKTPTETFWTHGNATKHMNEVVTTIKHDQQLAQANPKLLSQFVLYDYRKSLISATRNGVVFNKNIRTNHWDFRFSRRKGDENTVVIHALFSGFN